MENHFLAQCRRDNVEEPVERLENHPVHGGAQGAEEKVFPQKRHPAADHEAPRADKGRGLADPPCQGVGGLGQGFQGKGVARGLNYKLVQAPPDGGALENSLARAEDQLNPNGPYTRAVDVSGVTDVVNYSQNASSGGGDGLFGNDLPFPGEDPNVGNDNYAASFVAWLELPAGITRFGVVSDDGYKVASAVTPGPSTAPLEFHNGGPADERFDVVVPEAGLYAFRLVWYERTGGAHVEWFTEDRATGARTLINDAGGIRAFATVEAVAPSVVLESAAALGGSFAPEPGAVVDPAAGTIRAPAGAGDARFYRLKGASTIDSITLEGGNVVLRYR